MEFRQKAPEGKPNNDDDNKNTTADTNTPPTGKSYRDKHSIILRNIDNPPEPYFSFERPEFPPFILDIIRANGFKAFTPVQAQGIPIIMSGRDFIGISKTGSGKTLAFLIPAIIHLIGQNRDSRDTSILVLSPTRELAMQIENEFKKFLSRSRITWACVYGGIKKDYQRNSLLRGVQILVATPGRLIDFIQEDSISVEHVSYFVLDEADRMLDMGFAPQIREILSHMKKSKQSLMFSATWPFEIKQLADRYLTNPVSLQIGILERTINDSIKQDIKIVSYRDKFRELQKDLLRTTERRLIFVQRKIDCERICENLLNEGEKCVSIHGDKVQIHRDKALMQFKTGKIRILVATDVASRGLDIPDVELVINYDFPKQIEDYIHRIGRTGRAGKKGETVSYLTQGEDNRLGEDLIKVLRESSQVIPNELHSFSKRKGGDNKYEKFNKNRYNYDINATSGLDTWRTSKPTEQKSMKNFDEPRRENRDNRDTRDTRDNRETKGPYRSQKVISKPTKQLFRDKIYHPSINLECNGVLITIKMNDIFKANTQCIVVPCLNDQRDHKHTVKMSKMLAVSIFEESKKAKLGSLRELQPRSRQKKISYILTFQLPDNDSDGSFLSYILQKIIKQAVAKDYQSICLHELGMGRYPLELQCKTILYSLFEILSKEQKLERLDDIMILVEDEKEFVEYTRLYSRIVAEGTQLKNVVIENEEE